MVEKIILLIMKGKSSMILRKWMSLKSVEMAGPPASFCFAGRPTKLFGKSRAQSGIRMPSPNFRKARFESVHRFVVRHL